MDKFWNFVIIVVGFILILTLIGYFAKNYKSGNFSNFFNLSSYSSTGNTETVSVPKEACGFKVISPERNGRVANPIKITGFAKSECGWQVKDGILGEVRLETPEGTQITNFYPILPVGEFKNGVINFQASVPFDNNENWENVVLVFEGKSKKNNTLIVYLPVELYRGAFVGAGCRITGCFYEKCVDQGFVESGECNFSNEFVCYRQNFARCEKQIGGQCGWSDTPELAQCIFYKR